MLSRESVTAGSSRNRQRNENDRRRERAAETRGMLRRIVETLGPCAFRAVGAGRALGSPLASSACSCSCALAPAHNLKLYNTSQRNYGSHGTFTASTEDRLEEVKANVRDATIQYPALSLSLFLSLKMLCFLCLINTRLNELAAGHGSS